MPPPRVVNQLMEGRRIIGSNININLLKTPAVILDIADSEEDEQRERDIREAGFKIRADAGGPEVRHLQLYHVSLLTISSKVTFVRPNSTQICSHDRSPTSCRHSPRSPPGDVDSS